jgi:hypothetical protein
MCWSNKGKGKSGTIAVFCRREIFSRVEPTKQPARCGDSLRDTRLVARYALPVVAAGGYRHSPGTGPPL